MCSSPRHSLVGIRGGRNKFASAPSLARRRRTRRRLTWLGAASACGHLGSAEERRGAPRVAPIGVAEGAPIGVAEKA